MANIRKRHNRFQVQIRRSNQKSITKTFARFTEARAWAHKVEVALDRREAGIYTPPEETLEDLLIKYRQDITPNKKSYASECRRINRLLKEPIVKLQISKIKPKALAMYRDERLKSGVRAAGYDMQIIRHCINVAMSEWGLNLKSNPMLNVKMPPQSEPRSRRLHGNEYQRLLCCASSTKSWYLRPLIILAVETGMRLSELLNLCSEDVSSQGTFVIVRKSKNGTSRYIPLSEIALKTISDLTNGPGRLFDTNYNAVKSAWRRTLVKASINDLKFHDLRHEAISRFFEKGLTVPEVSSITGHKTMSMLLRYAHADFELVKYKLSQKDI